MKYFLFTCLIFASIFGGYANAQQDTTKTADPSLSGQYQFMLRKSKTLYGAKLINPERLNGLWKSVSDTLRKERKVLKEANTKISEQNIKLSKYEGQSNEASSLLKNSEQRENEIRFLGIAFTKSTYNMMVWSIIGILAIALLIVITRSTKNILEAKHRTELYEEINSEYQNFKAKANEKERKLARELQDERNKWDDANGR